MKIILLLNYILLGMPALSITQIFLQFYVNSRLLSLPFILVFASKLKTFPSYLFSIIFLIFLFLFYTILALYDNREILIYAAYMLSFIYILYLYMIIRHNSKYFIFFLKIFLVLNLIYSLWQLALLNIGIDNFTMIHSNHPAQENYKIPIFISEPFYRYTGMFNESSPFAFYLSIMYCMFDFLYRVRLDQSARKYKYVAFTLLILGGSKIGIIFILFHSAFIEKGFYLTKLFAILITLPIIIFLPENSLNIDTITYGQTASIYQRTEKLSDIQEYWTPFGIDLASTSEGNLDLNFVSIFIHGFGYIGMIFFILSSVYFIFKYKEKGAWPFILPFAVGLSTSGSLLITQYALFFGCLFYISIKKHEENHGKQD